MSGLQALSILVMVAGGLGMIVAGIFWLRPSRRSAAKCVQVGSVLALALGFVAFNQFSDGTPTEEPRAARVSATETAEADAACRADFECWGRAKRIDAEVRCKRAIEAHAEFAVEWTDSWDAPMFSRFSWADEETGVMTYFGDRLRVQNAHGAWATVVYSCDYDTDKDVAVATTMNNAL